MNNLGGGWNGKGESTTDRLLRRLRLCLKEGKCGLGKIGMGVVILLVTLESPWESPGGMRGEMRCV